MNDGTSDYWRKLLKIDEPVTEEYLDNFRSSLELFRPIFFFVANMLCRLYWRVEVFGLENIPIEPPYILAPNHASSMDQTMVSYAIGRGRRESLYTLAAKHFYDRLFTRTFIKIGSNAMRMDNAEDFMPAMRAAVKVLKLGRSVYINPEGTRSETGELLPFRVGVGVIAVESNVPIVPVYIKGTFEALPPGKLVPKPVKVKVCFGRAIQMAEYLKRKETGMAYDVYRAVTDELFKRILSLKVGKENV